ncbi:uncharacterized protein LOC114786216 isoform X2 [Denticeps clupeoides]|uniref:Uncharacterized protein n=1 Tax=Denticeps clupeoides TaxID=299321 RepID=A0AAY4B8I0_9TELE|nr:uncharacterized protein LOC114786216 isoform X2 [Denticeps clupeoides]
MASTEQSALDFITNGRSLLGERLQNLSVVLKELRSREVLSQKEINLIKSQKGNGYHTMLDLVIDKGEATCYNLLKILDYTRMQSFPPPGRYNPDLHHWLSCFPFGDDVLFQGDTCVDSDPCTKYQQSLKQRALHIIQDKWSQSMHFLKSKTISKTFRYIPLVLDTDVSDMTKIKNKAYKKSRSKKLKTYIPTDRKKLSPNQLLNNSERKILIVGKPGIGKTTVAQQVLKVWTEQEGQQGKYMFYFDEPQLRTLSCSSAPKSLRSLLFDMYLEPEHGTDEVFIDIEDNSDNVVIIFDGFVGVACNEAVKSVMTKEFLNEAKIFITCRTEAETSEFLCDWASYRVEVQGFNSNSIHEYFQWMLGSDSDSKCNAMNNPELFSLCHVPMYAFIVVACISFSPSEAHNQPYTITEMYVRIFRYCMQRHGNPDVEHLDKYIQDNKGDIRFLATTSYQALQAKTVNLTNLDFNGRNVQHAFLTSLSSKDPANPPNAFLHNTMQEFWAALFLLMVPDNIPNALRQCRTEDGKYLKHIFPFLCGLLSEKICQLIKCLISEEQIRKVSKEYFVEIIDTFLHRDKGEEDSDAEFDVEDLLFVCQCLYELQSPKACSHFLHEIDHHLDLSETDLDPQQCCTVSYVISQATFPKVQLDLTDCTVSDPGLKVFLGSLTKLKWLSLSSSTNCQMWKIALQSNPGSDFDKMLQLLDFEMHLKIQAQDDKDMYQRVGDVLQQTSKKVKLILHLDISHASESLVQAILEGSPNILDLRIVSSDQQKVSFLSDVYIHGAFSETRTGKRCVQGLLSLLKSTYDSLDDPCYFMLNLHSYAKSQSVIPVLLPLYQTIPSEWVVKLSVRQTSLVHEAMKLQKVKKPVELSLADELEELKIFFQCLPYVSQLRFNKAIFTHPQNPLKAIQALGDLFIYASENGRETLEMLSAVCSHSDFPFASDMKTQNVILMELLGYLRKSDEVTGSNILVALQPVYQSAPAGWILDLSEGKMSLIREALEFQNVKKPMEVRGWSGKEEDIQYFLQCLPYVSQISCDDLLFQAICGVLSAGRNFDPKSVSWILEPLDLSLTLRGMLHVRLCKAVGAVLANNDVEGKLCLSLHPQSISRQGAAALFSEITSLKKLRVNEIMTRQMKYLASSKRLAVDTFTLVLAKPDPPDRTWLKLMSILASLLRKWTIQSLDLTECNLEAHCIISLLSHDSPLSIRLCEGTLQQLAEFVYEAQDRRLTQLFLEKTGGDLSACTLPWNTLQYFIQKSDKILTLKESKVCQMPDLLQHLRKIGYKSISPQFMRAALREIFKRRAGHLVVDLMISSDGIMNLRGCNLDSSDCAALRFALQYSDGIKLNLFDSTIPVEETGRILALLERVSQLSVGKPLLLQLLDQTRTASEAETWRRASGLSRALGKQLDLSCTKINSQICNSLALVLEQAEELSLIDLSHCHLTDENLDLLLPHLFKAQVLDLSHNDITDHGAQKCHEALNKSCTQTVRLFSNWIRNVDIFITDKHYEMWCIGGEKVHKQNTSSPETSPRVLPKEKEQITEFDPTVEVQNDKISYRLQTPVGGRFQCRETGLVFVIRTQGCIRYSIDHWIFSKTCYQPAGPLYNIKATEGEIYQLYLPHCETDADAAGELDVVHLREKEHEVLTPIMCVRTHVIVWVQNLSHYGIVRKKIQASRTLGQVLLFLEPDMSDDEQRLWVFLLPRNVPLTEVKEQQKEYQFIQTSSNCILYQDTKYRLSSNLGKDQHSVQPLQFIFNSSYNKSHHAAFEMFFPIEVTEMRMRIQKRQKQTLTWSRRVILKGKCDTQVKSENQRRTSRSEKDWTVALTEILKELSKDEINTLKTFLRNPPKNLESISKGKLEEATGCSQLAELMVETLGFQKSIQATQWIMKKLPRNDEVVTSKLRPYIQLFQLQG